jgi:hypothetical protein
MKKLLVILSLAAMTNVSIASVEQVTLSNPPAGTTITSYPGGTRIAPVGDLNKDGIMDLAIAGVPVTGSPVAVVYGSANLPSTLDLSKIQTGNLAGQGFNVSYYDKSLGSFAAPITTVGADVNGDGYPDLVTVVDGVVVVVLFGSEGGFNQNFAQLQYYKASMDGYAFTDPDIQGFVADLLGTTFINWEKSDFNDDNKDDFVFTSKGLGLPGNRAMVFFGASGNAYQNQTVLPTVVGILSYTSPQVAVVANSTLSAAAGDVNGDNVSDFIAGTFTNATGSTVNVYYGSSTYGQSGTGVTTPTSFDSFVLLTGGTVQFVAGAGDVNGDKLDDMMVGASEGTIYVVYGKNGGVGPVTLDNLAGDHTRGFVIYGAAYPGCDIFKAISAGDMNADGRDDMAIIALKSGFICSSTSAKALIYIVYGKNEGVNNIYLNETTTFDGRVILDDSNSTICSSPTACDYIKGGNPVVTLVALGDVNGDKADDIGIGYGSGPSSHSVIVCGVNAANTTTVTPNVSGSSVIENVMAILF